MNAAWPLGELDTHIVGLIRGYACRRGFFCCVLLISSFAGRTKYTPALQSTKDNPTRMAILTDWLRLVPVEHLLDFRRVVRARQSQAQQHSSLLGCQVVASHNIALVSVVVRDHACADA